MNKIQIKNASWVKVTDIVVDWADSERLALKECKIISIDDSNQEEKNEYYYNIKSNFLLADGTEILIDYSVYQGEKGGKHYMAIHRIRMFNTYSTDVSVRYGVTKYTFLGFDYISKTLSKSDAVDLDILKAYLSAIYKGFLKVC